MGFNSVFKGLNEADSTQKYFMGLNRSTAVPLTKYSGECARKMQK